MPLTGHPFLRPRTNVRVSVSGFPFFFSFLFISVGFICWVPFPGWVSLGVLAMPQGQVCVSHSVPKSLNDSRGHRPIVDTCANEAISQWGKRRVINSVYLL